MKKFYDEVPFSKDYNYESLTTKEITWVMRYINKRDKIVKKSVVNAVLAAVAVVAIAVLVILNTVFVIDWRTIADMDYTVWPIGNHIISICLIIYIAFCFIKIAADTKKKKDKDETVLIAKGKIAGFKELHVVPDKWHSEGIKVMMTVSVSENDALPDFDITYPYRILYKEMVVGDDIIVLSFPQRSFVQGRYRFLYGPWEEKKSELTG